MGEERKGKNRKKKVRTRVLIVQVNPTKGTVFNLFKINFICIAFLTKVNVEKVALQNQKNIYGNVYEI